MTSLSAAESFNEVIKNATLLGQFRPGYISVTLDVAGSKTTIGATFSGEKIENSQVESFSIRHCALFFRKTRCLKCDNAKGELTGDFIDTTRIPLPIWVKPM